MSVISISLRRGASILATKPSKYLLAVRYLKQVRAGRITRSSDGGGKPRYFRREGKERKWSESIPSRRWVTLDKVFANASEEKYPELRNLVEPKISEVLEG
jgi:hypothetical protein